MKLKLSKEVKSTIVDIFIAIIVGIIISRFIIASVIVPTSSMVPTVDKGSMLLANRLAYIANSPERFDIIVFNSEELNKILIKRVIGLPGDTIEAKEGHLYINDKLLHEESFIDESVYTADFGPYTVPDNCYFVMGDNRTNSIDSRYWENKFVNKDDIIAKAFLEYKPKYKNV